MVQKFVDAGDNLHAQNNDRMNPLEMALALNRWDIVKVLINALLRKKKTLTRETM